MIRIPNLRPFPVLILLAALAVSAPEAAAAEPDDSLGTATSSGLVGTGFFSTTGAVGDGVFGATSGDYDFYSLEADAGDTISVRARDAASGLDPAVAVYDAAGTLLGANDDADGTSDSLLAVAAPAAGTYWAVVFGSGSGLPGDPAVPGTGGGIGSVGDYDLDLSLSPPPRITRLVFTFADSAMDMLWPPLAGQPSVLTGPMVAQYDGIVWVQFGVSTDYGTGLGGADCSDNDSSTPGALEPGGCAPALTFDTPGEDASASLQPSPGSLWTARTTIRGQLQMIDADVEQPPIDFHFSGGVGLKDFDWVRNLAQVIPDVFAIDTKGPVATITAPATSDRLPFSATIAFDEDLSEDLQQAEVQVTGGTVTGFVQDDGRTWTAEITPDGLGTVTITVAAGATEDAVAQFPNPSDEASAMVEIVPHADLSVTIDDGVNTAVPGLSVSPTVVVVNGGIDPDPAAALAAAFAPGLDCSFKSAATGGATGNTPSGTGDLVEVLSLPVGSSVTYSATCAIPPDLRGSLGHTASVTASEVDPDPSDDAASDTDTVLVPEADLRVAIAESADPVVAGSGAGNLSFVTSVANDGPSDATGVEVAHALGLPAGVTVDSVTPTAGVYAPAGAAVGTWTIGALAVGEERQLTAVLTVGSSAAAGTDVILADASVAAVAEGDPDPSDDAAAAATSVEVQSSLVLEKSDGLETAHPGDALTYTIVATKGGPSDLASATVEDLIPTGLGSVTWTCVPTGAATCALGPVSGDVVDTVSIPAGEGVTYTVSGTVHEDFLGVLENVVTVTSGFGVEQASDATTVFSPAVLEGTMTVAGDYTEGGEVRYSIFLTNVGLHRQFDNPGPELLDLLPPGLELLAARVVSGGGSAVADLGAGTVTWNGAIPSGGGVEIEIDARIRSGTNHTVISNQAEIFFDGDGDGTNEMATLTDGPSGGGLDPTSFLVGRIIEIPTLDGVGLALLAVLLAVVARRRLQPAGSPGRRP